MVQIGLVIEMESTEEVKRAFPGRSHQIDTLYSYLFDSPIVDNIYIYGCQSTGKTAVVKHLLDAMSLNHAVANLVECYTSKILFQSLLNQFEINAKCENLMDFVGVVRLHKDKFQNSVIVIDKAEKLRNMDFNLIGILKLWELTQVRICLIFISQLPLQKFYPKTYFTEPLKIYFPQYTREQLLEILILDYSFAESLIADHYGKTSIFDKKLFENYLNTFLSVFYLTCRDLCELRHNARINFINYCQPIVAGELKKNDTMHLWRKISPTLKNALEMIYLRISSKVETNLELPFYAKYLLIAAYLASYNAVQDDKRIFMKHHGKKRKTLKDIKNKAKVSESLNTQLGAKAFTLDRLLAIFYVIVGEDVGFNNNLLVQVSSLVELQLLTSLSDSCTLDSPKFKCNVNYDFIQNICRMVGFNIRKYLSDFCHL